MENPFSLERRCLDFPDACWGCRKCFAWSDFWERISREWAEKAKFIEFYESGPCDFCCEESCEGCPANVDGEELCDYTGEECIGNKLFCEECIVFAGELGEDEEDTSGWICRVCGCTDLTPCVGGCSWVEPYLCNICSRTLEADRRGSVEA